MKPLLLAHRGYSAKYPENTLLAFRKAIEAGVDGVECDVQRTRDGRYVILHDTSVDRTSNGRGEIASLDFEQTRAWDFGQGEKLPLLEELLEVVPADRWLNVEVKAGSLSAEHCIEIAEILKARRQKSGRASDHVSNTMISSFEHDWLPIFKHWGFETGMLIGEEHASIPPHRLIARFLKIRPKYANLPIQAYERTSARLVETLVAVLRLLGFKIIFWTVNDRAGFERVRGFSRFVITDEGTAAQEWRANGRS